MDFKILTKKLGFCEEAERFIFDFDKNYRHADFAPHWEKLYAAGEEAEGLNGLRAALAPDPDGMKILVCMLHCALHTHEAYRTRGIPDRIFFETMRFLPRFVNARARVYGRPIFPNDWWFYRELSLREFRLGALEYEMLADNGERKISVHIPEKADLSLPSLRASLREARKFFAEFFPEYADAELRFLADVARAQRTFARKLEHPRLSERIRTRPLGQGKRRLPGLDLPAAGHAPGAACGKHFPAKKSESISYRRRKDRLGARQNEKTSLCGVNGRQITLLP